MKTLYNINDLTLAFGPRTALDIKSLSIVSGRLHVLTGANGAGKSTLLSILAFLLPPRSGEIRFNGDLVSWRSTALGRLRQKVTLVHQSPYLFAGSVAENVAFGLDVRGVRGQEQQQRVNEALDMTGLAGFGARNALELSGGEARRVAMARALVLKPEVLLLDEPLANLDQETTALLEALITKLPQHGTTVIMTTHEAGYAERLGGTILHLTDGRVTQPAAAVRQPVLDRSMRLVPPQFSLQQA